MRTGRALEIRLALEAHVSLRLSQALKKLEGKEDSQSKKDREKAIAEYNLDNVIAEGAKYADQVQIATHIAKATHPDLKVKDVTNIRLQSSSMVSQTEVGTHALERGALPIDATGNGAINKKGYELYLLLNIPIEGQRFIDLLLKQDNDALAALNENLSVAQELASMAVLIEQNKCEKLSSHTLAKQIYWCISGESSDDSGFHLLQPMFSSSLAHQVHKEITQARYLDEENKAARQAFYKKEPHDSAYREYKDLAIRKLGGTKPQNISQLNSERGGVNYLLASLPPVWQQIRQPEILFVDSALEQFFHYKGVKGLIRELTEFMKTDGSRTMETESIRGKIECELFDLLAVFGWSVSQANEPGWTRNSDCHLVECEKLWLDPERAELPLQAEWQEQDEAFQQKFVLKQWQDELASRAARWLNARLTKVGLPVGDVELKRWAKLAKKALVAVEWQPRIVKQEVSHD